MNISKYKIKISKKSKTIYTVYTYIRKVGLYENNILKY